MRSTGSDGRRDVGSIAAVLPEADLHAVALAPRCAEHDRDDQARDEPCRTPSIRVATLVIQAEDDPFMTPDVLPDPGELSDCVTLQVTPRGGHVGFVEGAPWQPGYWLERRIPEFLELRLQK